MRLSQGSGLGRRVSAVRSASVAGRRLAGAGRVSDGGALRVKCSLDSGCSRGGGERVSAGAERGEIDAI
jgi:hypothetical protein